MAQLKKWPQDLIKDLWGYETEDVDEINNFISSYDVLLNKLKSGSSKFYKIEYYVVFDEYYRLGFSKSMIARAHNVSRQTISNYMKKTLRILNCFIRTNAGMEYTLSIFPNEPATLKRKRSSILRRNNFNQNHINIFLRHGISKENICHLDPDDIVNMRGVGKVACALTLRYLGDDYLKRYWPNCNRTVKDMTEDEIYAMFKSWSSVVKNAEP